MKLQKLILLVPIVVVLGVIGGITRQQPVEAASSGDVVINELMYNPLSDNTQDDFIELHNTTANTVSLDGWCLADGITLCFTTGHQIGPYGYVIASPNATQTNTTYGVTPIATYSGNLSNGGELVTLRDETSTIIDAVEYDDASPWPVSPDGNGPSLERIDAFGDSNDPSNWGASLATHGTPGQENSISNISLPTISDVTRPKIVAANTQTIITATVDDATTVQLIYRTMFNTEVMLTMYDDGAHGDGAANDGQYGAAIPGQPGGTLVRFKVSATNSDGTLSRPGTDDSINYYPYIANDGQTSDLPIVRWYMDPAHYTDMTTNHLTDDEEFPAIVAVGDQIFDNSTVNVKGQSSVHFPKRKYKFNLPSGHLLGSPAFEHPVKEFSIQVYFLNFTDLQEGLALRVIKEFGFTGLQNRYVRAQRNSVSNPSQFIGHYLLMENYDGRWRERNGFDSGAFYKEGNDKKTRTDEDNSDLDALVNNLTTLTGDELKEYLLDNLDIPNIINYNALSAAMFHQDWTFYKNTYQYRDTEGTRRWEYQPWDLDNAFSPSLFDMPQNGSHFLRYPISGEYYATLPFGGQDYYDNAIIEKAVYQFPEFREMFFRRSMNLYDQIWANDRYLEWLDDLIEPSRETLIEDLALWNEPRKLLYESIFPGGLPFPIPDDFPLALQPENFYDYLDSQTPETMRELYIYGANRHKAQVASMRANGDVLGRQAATSVDQVQITEIHYNPDNNDDLEFVEIFNNTEAPIDVSGWSIPELNFVFPLGSVLPSKGHGVIVANDVAFRDEYPSTLVFGEFAEDLSNEGQQLSLNNEQHQTISSVDYGTEAPWPTSPNGEGYTLGLVTNGSNTTNAACWAPSSDINGTPGLTNNSDSSWAQSRQAACVASSRAGNNGGGPLGATGANLAALRILATITLLTAVAKILYNRRRTKQTSH